MQRAEILTQALPYIQKYNGKIVVVKYGGNAMTSEDLKQQVMEDIVLMSLIGVKIVLVHGGGPEITELLGKIGKKSEFVDGLRVTDRETVDVVQMVLAGKINKSLVNLLEMKGEKSAGNTSVSRMRPSAIREAAQLVTFQTAIAWRYGQLVSQTERHSAVMDAAFNFSPLLLTQGDALIMPPLIARSGASMRIEDSMTATAAMSTYELLEPARYIAAAPHWREFLMMDDFPAPESPHPAVLPRNSEERAIWRSAVREAWAQGLAEADLLYADNVARMTRSYRGAMLYHLLTAQHLLSRIRTASSETGIRTSGKGNLLHIGQRVYRITAPSAFTVSLPTSPKKGAGR